MLVIKYCAYIDYVSVHHYYDPDGTLAERLCRMDGKSFDVVVEIYMKDSTKNYQLTLTPYEFKADKWLKTFGQ